jgi:hypothetical protein
MFRLRHAFIKFNWNTTELLIGQYWHPLFVTTCYPGNYLMSSPSTFLKGASNQSIAAN